MTKEVKANRLILEEKVVLEENTPIRLFFDVKGYKVRWNKVGLIFESCTCRSYVFKPSIICSHMIAVLKYMEAVTNGKSNEIKRS